MISDRHRRLLWQEDQLVDRSKIKLYSRESCV